MLNICILDSIRIAFSCLYRQLLVVGFTVYTVSLSVDGWCCLHGYGTCVAIKKSGTKCTCANFRNMNQASVTRAIPTMCHKKSITDLLICIKNLHALPGNSGLSLVQVKLRNLGILFTMAMHHFCLNGIIKDFELDPTPSTTPRVVAVLNLACAMLSMSLSFFH